MKIDLKIKCLFKRKGEEMLLTKKEIEELVIAKRLIFPHSEDIKERPDKRKLKSYLNHETTYRTQEQRIEN